MLNCPLWFRPALVHLFTRVWGFIVCLQLFSLSQKLLFAGPFPVLPDTTMVYLFSRAAVLLICDLYLEIITACCLCLHLCRKQLEDFSFPLIILSFFPSPLLTFPLADPCPSLPLLLNLQLTLAFRRLPVLILGSADLHLPYRNCWKHATIFCEWHTMT